MPSGRPTKYSKGRAEAICNALKIGATRTAACEANEIDLDTFRRWMIANTEFCGLVTHAEGQAELMFTATLYKAAKGTPDNPSDWRAAESWLKRRRRHEWSDNITLRNDTEASRLIAELFPEEAIGNLEPAPIGIEP